MELRKNRYETHMKQAIFPTVQRDLNLYYRHNAINNENHACQSPKPQRIQ